LESGRGILVPFRDAAAVATAVNSVLGDPRRKRELEGRAYEYGKEMAWPAIGRRVLAAMRDILDHRIAAPAAQLLVPQPEPTPVAVEPEERVEDEATPIA
jgi:hypothetical protein